MNLTAKEILHNYLAKAKPDKAFEQSVAMFFLSHGHAHNLAHSIDVANEAVAIAKRFNCNPKKAKIAGYLHDISAVIPNSDRISLAQDLGVDILEEERDFPMIIHQKLSVIIAKELVSINDLEILNAIGYHTTLKANSTLLDQVLFVADKIRWDGKGEPPYLKGILAALKESLKAASFYYIEYLYKQKDSLKVIHPFLLEAYNDLKIQ